ncbi:Trk system potassium transporter TrkA [bacterium]|nr:Trk system potassium transporter TrkA [bacterium]
MKIVVAGAGEVGFNLIENLSREDLDISVIDIDAEVLDRLKQEFGVKTDYSNIIDSRYISPSYLSDADLFLAITNSDETNMIACKLASEAGAQKTICRIRQIDLSATNRQFSLKSLGIDWVINPVSLVADELIRIVLTPNIVDSHEFLNGDIMLTGYRMTEYSRIIGRKIGDLEKSMSKSQIQIVIFQRKNISFIPHRDDVIKYGDIIYFIYRSKDFVTLRKVLGYAQKQAKTKRIFINGGGNIGLCLAERLEKWNQDVKVIEQDLARSYQIAEKLQKSLVLNFDGTDLDQLKAEGIENADFFIAVTDNEQINLTSSLLACEQGVERTICLVQQPELIQIISQNTPISLGISPRIISARYLVQFIQGTNVSSYFSLVNSQLEVLEVHLGPQARCLNAALREINLPENVRVGIIKRSSEYLQPDANSKLKSGDIILLILHRFDRGKALEFFS